MGFHRGSCLGPLLFILYLENFESCLKFSKANIYADDTEVSFSSSDLSDVTRNFQAELEKVSEWMRLNKLISIQPEKTVCVFEKTIHEGRILELTLFYLNDLKIKQAQKTKYLGLIVDDSLSWNEQYRSVKEKVVCGLATLRELKNNILPQSQLLDVC